jgi:adenylate kinase family enzyme
MWRVLAIGSPGAGKSTLAAELARRTGLPLVHLDQHYWRVGWVEPDKREWAYQVARLITHDRWIMDGNYSGTLDLRLARADTVLDLEFPAWLCFARVVRRSWRGRGRPRADMAEGCPERLSPALLWWTLKYPFTSRKRVERTLAMFEGRVIKLTSRAAVSRFLASFDEGG